MPVTQPSSCAFGPGETLYITTARAGLSPRGLAEQPHPGPVSALATNTRGVPVHPFCPLRGRASAAKPGRPIRPIGNMSP